MRNISLHLGIRFYNKYFAKILICKNLNKYLKTSPIKTCLYFDIIFKHQKNIVEKGIKWQN